METKAFSCPDCGAGWISVDEVPQGFLCVNPDCPSRKRTRSEAPVALSESGKRLLYEFLEFWNAWYLIQNKDIVAFTRILRSTYGDQMFDAGLRELRRMAGMK